MKISKQIMRKLLSFLAIVLFVHTANAQMEFIQNKGQWDSRVEYRGDFSTGSFFLEKDGFTVAVQIGRASCRERVYSSV